MIGTAILSIAVIILGIVNVMQAKEIRDIKTRLRL